MLKQVLGISVLAALSINVWAEDVHVAVAANFSKPMKQIAADYEKASGNKVLVSEGASGKLVEQIKNGAPFEVFLSADQKNPIKLETEKLDVSGSRFTYAIGKLVLWSAKEGLVDDQGAVIGCTLINTFTDFFNVHIKAIVITNSIEQ